MGLQGLYQLKRRRMMSCMWLLKGGNVFHIPRPSGSGRHVLVGVVFHGLMNGELAGFSDIVKGLPPPKTVQLE